MKRYFLAVLLLCSCTPNPNPNPDAVVMTNPATSEVVVCRRYPWGSVISDDVEQCVIGYKAEGWVVSR